MRILAIVGRVPQDPLAIAAFLRASQMLAGRWTSDDDGQRHGNRDYEGEYDVSRRIRGVSPAHDARGGAGRAGAAARLPSRVILAKFAPVMHGLTGIQDRNPNTPRYWFLWEQIATALRGAKWVSRLDADRYWTGSELLSAVFLTQNWNDGVRYWRFLEGYAHLVHALFEALPATSTDPARLPRDSATRSR